MSAEFSVVFALYPRVTQLDFTGPYEVFWRLPGAECIFASVTGGDLQVDGGATPDPARVVRDGNVCTGGGVTAGIDFALTVVAEVAGPEYAQTVQLSIEYAPDPPFDTGRPELAPAQVLGAAQRRYDGFRALRDAAVARAAARLC